MSMNKLNSIHSHFVTLNAADAKDLTWRTTSSDFFMFPLSVSTD